jgi:phosphotriesterase-related protein
MHIQAVNGPISPESLGITLSHEHILIDYRCSWIAPPPEYSHLPDSKVTQELIADIRCHAHNSKDNLIMDDEDTAVEELMRFKSIGGNAIIEFSNIGLGIDPLKLRRISVRTGLHIIIGCGYYRYVAQEPSILNLSAEQMAEEIVRNLHEGVSDTNIRAGIIGEVGTSFPLHPFERESLIASARAQRQTGVAINVHPEPVEHEHLQLLNILEDAGADLSRTAMSHVDELNEPDWHSEIAKRGVYLSFDTFGLDFPFDGTEKPRDTDRVNCLISLLEKGYIDRILLSGDTCYKIQLRKYGGRGYSQILTSIVPLLRERGVSESEITKILVENPKRLLTIAS